MTLAHYTLFAWIWIAIAVIIFISLLFITAPYGRHTKSTWGPLIDNRLGWVVMEVVVLIVLYYFAFTGTEKQSLVNCIILSFFTIHYINRTFIFPFMIRTKGKKMPVSIAIMGIAFNIANGFLIGYYLGNFKVYDNAWLHHPAFIIGTLIFFVAFIINLKSDHILIHLRKPNETGYKIPQGGLFRYISCPNLFSETVEWGGFALLTWSLPGFAFFVWSFANLIPRAISHHKWYKMKFDNYPKDRKAVIPFIL